MKRLISVFAIFLSMLTLLAIAGCVTTTNTISEEEFYKNWSGTWVNTDIPPTEFTPQKLVNYPDGTSETYVTATYSSPFCVLKLTSLRLWTDSRGNIWYTGIRKCLTHKKEFYWYGKIHKSGKTHELIWSYYLMDKWEPDNILHKYNIYYRE